MSNFKKNFNIALWIIFVMFPISLIAIPFYTISLLIEPLSIWATKRLDKIKGDK